MAPIFPCIAVCIDETIYTQCALRAFPKYHFSRHHEHAQCEDHGQATENSRFDDSLTALQMVFHDAHSEKLCATGRAFTGLAGAGPNHAIIMVKKSGPISYGVPYTPYIQKEGS